MTTCETSSQLDKCCTNVESEPYLTELQGETFELRTANSSSGARLDIKARNYLRQGQNTYFDIRVTHVSHQTLATAQIFKRQEDEKKRQYNQRIMDVENGSVTPLIIGTNGGMGSECQTFVKNLADLLSRKQNEDYGSTLTLIRTKLSFEILRSTVLCVRGSRKLWCSNTSRLTSDFGLHLSEADINASA